MKFVALVSGGKDSCFNIVSCINNGHDLIALANLYPSHGSDELDSFMYQTVGYQAVELYGDALGVPLYRAPILGTAVSQDLDYSPTLDDESEDLFKLLKSVTQAHPDVEAVSVGAILSNYQRTRVENVCQRLGLVSLAYLWQRSQAELLDEIIASGLDARIIKTAGIGLNRSHLGKSLAEMRPTLIKLNSTYGLHLCGEGGEYETLVLDGPIFRKRLEIVASETVDHSSGDVCYLSLRFRLEDKGDVSSSIEGSSTAPPLLEARFKDMEEDVAEAYDAANSRECHAKTPVHLSVKPETFSHRSGDFIQFCNVTSDAESTIAQVDDIFSKLNALLSSQGFTIDDLSAISLLVPDMREFADINTLYTRQFTKPNPPVRVCIQASSPFVQLSAVASKATPRSGLHVQGWSYWAPANIGPYSQSISVDGLDFLAGQIPLVPFVMALDEKASSVDQVLLSLQNLTRVSEVTHGDSWAYGVSFVDSSLGIEEGCKLRAAAEASWSSLAESQGLFNSPGLLVAAVPRLPRNATVEWVSLGIDHSYHEQSIPDDEADNYESYVWPPKITREQGCEIVKFGHRVSLVASSESDIDLDEKVKSFGFKVLSATIYTSIGSPKGLSFAHELISVDWLSHNGSSASYGAVILGSVLE